MTTPAHRDQVPGRGATSEDRDGGARARLARLAVDTRARPAGDGRPAAPPAWVPAAPGTAPDGSDDAPDGPDDPRERAAALRGAALRDRALAAAVTGYTAAHGHPLDHPAAAPGSSGWSGRRWAVRPATVALAAVVLVLVVGLVGLLALRPPPATVVGGPPADAPTGTAQDAAGADPAGGAPTAGPGAPDGGESAAAQAVVVHVVGQVAAPGLLELPAGSRVADAVDAAGGALPSADLTALNLAREVTDGEQVVVPAPGETVAVPQGTGGGSSQPGPLDLNRADLAALDELPGIGPVLAERIVAWRDEHGPFTTVEELAEVPGIGPSLLADLRELVRV
ncbi:ComEA family DNA-binding protein [Actinotalea sp. JY-7876]|uniref:ComEA family DNA-binding protein n=1 Tax=Actinotalea sp. JY-7876 TaxID=2758442 RepID=UPI00210587A6|nr:ComEA family DNA-binding protein [Actinotalea sp. JY-7876]